jgi:hypothetical protein
VHVAAADTNGGNLHKNLVSLKGRYRGRAKFDGTLLQEIGDVHPVGHQVPSAGENEAKVARDPRSNREVSAARSYPRLIDGLSVACTLLGGVPLRPHFGLNQRVPAGDIAHPLCTGELGSETQGD